MCKEYIDIESLKAKKVIGMTIVEFEDEEYYKMSNHNSMRPFFMSIVSNSDHWMFISSNGGITAGRKNPDYSLFPYYTDDKVTESFDTTGNKSIFQIVINNIIYIWEPFSERFTNKYNISRNLYKNRYGNKIIFEEVNHNLNLTFRYKWCLSNIFGFVKQNELINTSNDDLKVTLLDGIQNIMPYGVGSYLQTTTSNLVNAYKRNELHKDSGIGIYSLSAIIVDKAEPSEALKANIAWSLGLSNPKHLVSSLQLDNFRKCHIITEEEDVKGEKGSYFVFSEILLPANLSKKWKIVANVNQNHSQIVNLCQSIVENSNLENQLDEDIKLGSQNLIQLVASADGLQLTADQQKNTRHFSNVLFNIMRGGIFDENYKIDKEDFVRYLCNANKEVITRNKVFIDNLTPTFNQCELKELAQNSADVDLIRLSIEYLPLKFSRRHGDPSRPWNSFSINTRNETDGSKILDYEGNWRDLFQNWEALAHSYPEFIEGMIFKFVNASTFDGYNPYRITKGGFDWETIEPENPWSYIGYWGDHQVIYLLKFLEFFENLNRKELEKLFNSEYFVYANVPYRIKSYCDIVKDPKNTISFDAKLDHIVRDKIAKKGADASLLGNSQNDIHHVNFLEKILAMVLAKVSNFIPEGGIWMNTQRPEWNDANNALVGNGVSMVTLYYLRRFLKFFEKILTQTNIDQVPVSNEIAEFFINIYFVLESNQKVLSKKINDNDRKQITDALGSAGSNFRDLIYSNGFSGKKYNLTISQISNFTKVALTYLEHTIDANRRSDNLYHAYNILSINENKMTISHLSEMLEGQVAVISSGYLRPIDTVRVLDSLRNSSLYRKDQNSYLLYPNKSLPRFLEKNKIAKELLERSALLIKLVEDKNLQIVNQDITGNYHFDGNFKNANDLRRALENLKTNKYQSITENDIAIILGVFEEVFNHKAFTGRSGTFYAYEGLGSIYWHMVSKLHLAVHEACLNAINLGENDEIVNRLKEYHSEIGDGIGIHKSPELYGAFPTDPYSHTPFHKGAQQPGMTGQVKEDIIVRFGELGVTVKEGKIHFNPSLLKMDEFLTEQKIFKYFNIHKEQKQIELNPNSLSFTFCQIPVVYEIADKEAMVVGFSDGTSHTFKSFALDKETSQQVFKRTGVVKQITLSISANRLNSNL
jgi:hypothetical protein